MSSIKNLKEMIHYSQDGILSKEILKTSKLSSTLFCMAAGTKISEHTSAREGFIYVIEGKGIFVLEGEEITLEQGRTISMKEKAVHSLKAEGNTSFILMLV